MANEEFGNRSESELSDEELEDIYGGVIHRMAARRWEVLDQAGNIAATVTSRSLAIAKAKELGVSPSEVDWYKYWDLRNRAEHPEEYLDEEDDD